MITMMTTMMITRMTTKMVVMVMVMMAKELSLTKPGCHEMVSCRRDTGNNNSNNNNNNNNRIERRNSRFFFLFLTIASLHRELSPTRTLKWPGRNRVQITCDTQSAHHVQHVVCRLVRRDSSAIKIGRVSVAFILALFNWLKRLTDEGGEETGETP